MATEMHAETAQAHAAGPAGRNPRRIAIGVAALVALAAAGAWGYPRLDRMLHTATTDDAYVNGHVSLIAPRIEDNVLEVLVDDNYYVRPGTVLVRLDPVPYQVAVDQRKAMLQVAEADLEQARVQTRAAEARGRAAWFTMISAQEQGRFQIATLHSDVSYLKLQQANLVLAQQQYERERALVARSASTAENLDQRRDTLDVARQQVLDAQARIQRTRANLGIAPVSDDPLAMPKDLEEDLSAVQTALSQMVEAMAQIGVSFKLRNLKPSEAHKLLEKMDPSGDLNVVLDKLIDKAPAVLLAEAKVVQARRDLEQAELNLSYTTIASPIEGFVNRRNVNPGNHVLPGQQLLAVRSLKEIWVDANFKETELGDIRIGLPVTIRADAYRGKVYKARVAGFGAGTGSTLALLPAQNATGNFVKIVQRLPVRIELNDPNPADTPLLIGLSVIPEVDLRGTPEGPDAGQRLVGPAGALKSAPGTLETPKGN